MVNPSHIKKVTPKSIFPKPDTIFDGIILLASLFILVPGNMFSYPHNGLDPSWMIAINMAVEQNLIFGKEFIYTYGPLGFLYTSLPLYIPKIVIVFFHLFVLINIGIIISSFLKQIISKWAKIAFVVFLLFAFLNLYEEKAFLLLILFLFHAFKYLYSRRQLSLYLAGFIALLTFFVKLNTGLFITFLLVPYLFFLNYLKIQKFTFTAIYLLVFIVFIFIFSYLLNVYVFSYIANGLDIINTYNDAVSKPPTPLMFLIAVAVILVFMLTLFVDIKAVVTNKKRMFVALYVSLASFVLFKEGFVRADGHMMLFFGNIIALFGFLYLFENDRRIRMHRLFGILLIALFCFLSDQVYFGLRNPIEKALLKIDRIPYKDFLTGEHSKMAGMVNENEKRNAMIPQRILDKLKGKTVDIIPTDISYIYFNGLQYNPRPSIQSYASYSENLDEINASKYASESAPDYILFAMGSIDDRHPFWDETKTKLAMLTNYQFDDTVHIHSEYTHQGANEDFILLHKRDSKLELIETGSTTLLYQLGDTLLLPQSDKLMLMYADVQYNIFGKLLRLLFQPNRLSAEIWYDGFDNPSLNVAIKPIMKGGVLINKKVLTYNDAIDFFEFHGQNNTDVRSICIAPKYGYKLGFKDKVSLTLKEFKIE